VLHQFAVLLVEMVSRLHQNNAIMETKLDVKLAVFPILASLVLELWVLLQFVFLNLVATPFYKLDNNAIMDINQVVLFVKLFLVMFALDLCGLLQFALKNVATALRLSINNVIMVVRKDVQPVISKQVSLALIIYTLYPCVTKIVEMELELTLRNVIMGIMQGAQLIVK
jgi:hypothetical protein